MTSLKVAEVLVRPALTLRGRPSYANLLKSALRGWSLPAGDSGSSGYVSFNFEFHAYLDFAYWEKQPIVEWALSQSERLDFPQDRHLSEELAHESYGPYKLLAGELKMKYLLYGCRRLYQG